MANPASTVRRPSLDAVRGFDRAVYVVAAGQLLNVFGAGLVYPFATVHFHLRLGVALSLVGFGLLVKHVTTALATVAGGVLADHRGRKPLMVASMAGNAVTLSAYAAVPDLARAVAPLTPGWAFVAVSGAAGLTGGLYTPASQAYVAGLTDGDERDRAFSVLKVANNVGFGVGFVVGGLLYEVVAAAVFVADGATSGVVAAIILLAVPATDRGGDGGSRRAAVLGWVRAVGDPRVIALAALNVGFAVMYAQMQATVPVVAEGRLGLDAAQLGTLYVLNPLTLVVVQLPAVEAVASLRRTRALAISAGLWAASMAAVWLSYLPGVSAVVGLLLVGAHLVVRTVGEALHSPLATSLMSALGGDADRGSRLSLLAVAKRAGFGLGSFAGGVFFDAGVAAALWPTLLVTCVAIAVGLLALERHVSPAENGVAGG